MQRPDRRGCVAGPVQGPTYLIPGSDGSVGQAGLFNRQDVLHHYPPPLHGSTATSC